MFLGKEKRELMGKMQDCIEGVQANNIVLADTLRHVMEISQPNKNNTEKTQYTEDEKWKAAYALNLCTVSISQIIEYNDLRFMDQEYENILNNLNLEMMPKDEALLDVLKQILDIITFFRIQDKERKLLEKEYQQKMKDAIWSAAPNPAVIMSGGSSGWVGLAVTAAISIGTGYMNYRKEKAKIGLEQERKEWELERSLMEQLHGLRRQLFETSWRLADEYEFSDLLRLTEKQIKQFNEILQDDSPLRQYYRLEYIQSQYEAYPPFWYYLGSAALKVANDFKNNANICELYLEKANAHFDYYFEKSAFENKLLREDPITAQCAFEYIATLDMKKEMGFLTIDPLEKDRLISEKLDLAVKSSGNALDVLQMCALQYLAADRTAEAIPVLKMLVNEFYNVSSNAQLLSMLFVKGAVSGQKECEVGYDLLVQTCPYEIEFYTMPQDKNKVNFEILDIDFCKRQKVYLARRYLESVEEYINREEIIFNQIWGMGEDIAEELVEFFNDFAQAMNVLRPERGTTIVKDELSKIWSKIKQEDRELSLLSDPSARVNYQFISFVGGTVTRILGDVFEQLNHARCYKDLSNLEIKLIDFCDKHSLVNEKNIIVSHNNDNEQTIESILTGQSLAQIKIQEQEFEECFKVIKGAGLKGKIIASDSKKGVECYYSDSRQYEEYYSKNSSVIKSLKGRVLAVVEDKQGVIKGVIKNDLIFTTRKIYIATKTWLNPDLKVKCGKDYNEVRISAKSSTLEDISGDKLYNQAQKEINYAALGEMLHQLKKVTEKYSTQITESGSCERIMQEARIVAIKAFGRGISEARSQRLLTATTGHNSNNDSYATVLSVTKVEKGIALKVKIHRGSFSTGDQVEILKSDGDSTWADTICYIYGNNQHFDRADQGAEVYFTFVDMTSDCADIGSEIKII